LEKAFLEATLALIIAGLSCCESLSTPSFYNEIGANNIVSR